ncbi:rCG28175, isoform CRA_b, partial [Rattus norvegicus]
MLQIHIPGRPTLFVRAMIDSGASGNFIDQNFVIQNAIPLRIKEWPIMVEAIDGHPIASGPIILETHHLIVDLGDHREILSFDVTQSPFFPIVLGIRWLSTHDPNITWSARSIVFNSDYCRLRCRVFAQIPPPLLFPVPHPPLHPNVHPNLQQHVHPDPFLSLQQHLQQRLHPEVQHYLQQHLHPQVLNYLQQCLQPELQHYLQHHLRPELQHYLQHHLHPELQHYLYHHLHSDMQHLLYPDPRNHPEPCHRPDSHDHPPPDSPQPPDLSQQLHPDPQQD